MDRIRNRPKMPPRIKTAADAIKADSAEIAKMKSESMKSLSDDPIMSNIIRKDLKLTKKEVADIMAWTSMSMRCIPFRPEQATGRLKRIAKEYMKTTDAASDGSKK